MDKRTALLSSGIQMNIFSYDVKHQCFSSDWVGIFEAVHFSSFHTLNLQLCNIIKRIGKQTLLEYLPCNLTADGDTHYESDDKDNGDSEEKAKVLMTA